MSTKRKLKRRYATAVKRVKREGVLLEQARSRKNYWAKIARDIETRLELLQKGQMEFRFN